MGAVFALGLVGVLLVCFIILLGVLFTGLVLLITGIIAGIHYKKKGLARKWPKVLTVTGLIFAILPIILIAGFILPSNKPSPEEIYERQTAKVIEAFVNQDADGLREAFLENKRTKLLDNKIMDAFACIDGDIVSYEQLKSETHGGGSNEEYIYDDYEGGYSPVVTSTGKQYSIYINSLIIWNREDESGVESIVVEEITEENEEMLIRIE